MLSSAHSTEPYIQKLSNYCDNIELVCRMGLWPSPFLSPFVLASIYIFSFSKQSDRTDSHVTCFFLLFSSLWNGCLLKWMLDLLSSWFWYVYWLISCDLIQELTCVMHPVELQFHNSKHSLPSFFFFLVCLLDCLFLTLGYLWNVWWPNFPFSRQKWNQGPRGHCTHIIQEIEPVILPHLCS